MGVSTRSPAKLVHEEEKESVGESKLTDIAGMSELQSKKEKRKSKNSCIAASTFWKKKR